MKTRIDQSRTTALYSKRSQVRCFDQDASTWRTPQSRPRSCWRHYTSYLARNTSESPWRRWKVLLGRRTSGIPCLGCCHRKATQISRRQWTDGPIKTRVWLFPCIFNHIKMIMPKKCIISAKTAYKIAVTTKQQAVVLCRCSVAANNMFLFLVRVTRLSLDMPDWRFSPYRNRLDHVHQSCSRTSERVCKLLHLVTISDLIGSRLTQYKGRSCYRHCSRAVVHSCM